MAGKIVLIAAVIGVCRMAGGQRDVEYVANYPRYYYSYGVNNPPTDDFKRHAESRDGDVVHGFYTEKRADGNIQTVRYTVSDATGFQAAVDVDSSGSGASIISPSDTISSTARPAIIPTPTRAAVPVPMYPSPVVRSDARGRGFSYSFSTPVDNFARIYQPPVTPYNHKPAVRYYQEPRYTPASYQPYQTFYYGQPYYSASRYQEPILSKGYLPAPDRSSNYVTFSSPHTFYSHNLK